MVSDTVVASILDDIARVPDVVRATGGSVPFHPGQGAGQEFVAVNCLYQRCPQSGDSGLALKWLRLQTRAIVAVIRTRYPKEIGAFVNLTIRLSDKGVNHIVYWCDIDLGRPDNNSDVAGDAAPGFCMREWTHDDEIKGVLPANG